MKADQKAIEKKAYQLFQKRGYTHGNDLDDWLKAEKEVVGKKNTTSKAKVKTKK